MKTIRIYHPEPLTCGQSVELSSSGSQHVGTVLRMQPQQELILFCGDDHEYGATISAVHKKKVVVTVHTTVSVSRESPCKIHLAQGISKGERMEMVVQKAVELGVSSITPLITERCVVRLDEERMNKKQAQWQAIAISACEQSGRNRIPLVLAPLTLNHFLLQCSSTIKFVLDPEGIASWRDCDLTKHEIALLIGPEGGLTEAEIKSAQDKNFTSLRLGPRVLRTETAAITALSVLQAIAGDL
jgi:16S rRNA (uracil1498-N3)-methyltransferase